MPTREEKRENYRAHIAQQEAERQKYEDERGYQQEILAAIDAGEFNDLWDADDLEESLEVMREKTRGLIKHCEAKIRMCNVVIRSAQKNLDGVKVTPPPAGRRARKS